MLKKLILICVFMSLAVNIEARSIRVLILDDVFQNIPKKNENLDRMGKLQGELLVNGTHYSGDIEVWKSGSGMYLINELPLEEYIQKVVSSEVGANWDIEALKAQAVIARTYALYQKSSSGAASYDITSSVLHQVYKSNAVDARISYAVMNTEGEVLLYDGKLIEAFYHSTSCGKTEDPVEVFGKSYPYLKPVDVNADISPYYIWERKIPVEEIEKSLNVTGLKEIRIINYTSTNRVRTVDIIHDNGVLTLKATDLRKLLGWSRLPSTQFTFTHDNGNIVFEGKGYGHGVGLCQWSALEMARDGKTYKEILSYFYPGTTLSVYEDR